MLKAESKVFFHLPDDSGVRILHPGKIVDVNESIYKAELEEDILDIENGLDVLIYYEINRKFVRHAARIESVIEAEPNTMVEFITIGEPVSAKSRQVFRVTLVGDELRAKFGGEEDCPVVDLSPTGLAVYSTASYKIGNRVETTLYHEGQAFSGTVAIRSVKEIRRGRIRYGVYCIDDAKSSLKKALPQISMALQRRQLSRFSRLR